MSSGCSNAIRRRSSKHFYFIFFLRFSLTSAENCGEAGSGNRTSPDFRDYALSLEFPGFFSSTEIDLWSTDMKGKYGTKVLRDKKGPLKRFSVLNGVPKKCSKL